tara:strand:- start:84 stop:995 length:912 start_codon:yes stop_codon:yes gene_type:complete
VIKHFLFIVLIIPCFGDVFTTPLGECTLEIYGGEVEDIPEIVKLIKGESRNLVETLGEVETRPYSVYLTADMKDFNQKSRGPVPEWGIAVAKRNPDRAILKAPGIANVSYPRMKEVIIHELNHIYMFRIPNYSTMPSWFKEGMAMAASNEFSLLHKLEISKSLWNETSVTLQRLHFFGRLPKNKIKLAYGESAAAVEALHYYYGEDASVLLLDKMRGDLEFTEALELVIGEEYLEFQIKFEIYLEENYSWVFLLRSGNYLYVLLPLILVLGFWYKTYRNRLKLKQWEIEEALEKSQWQDELPN